MGWVLWGTGGGVVGPPKNHKVRTLTWELAKISRSVRWVGGTRRERNGDGGEKEEGLRKGGGKGGIETI